MKFFEAKISTIVLRLYLMMAIVIGSLFAGVPWLVLLSLPVFLSATLGVSFNPKKPPKQRNSTEPFEAIRGKIIDKAA